MIVDSHGEHLLGVVLSDHIIVQKRLDLLGLQQINIAEIRSFAVWLSGKLLLQDLRAQLNAVVADKDIVGTGDQLSHLVLRLPAEGTSNLVVCSAWHLITSLYKS